LERLRSARVIGPDSFYLSCSRVHCLFQPAASRQPRGSISAPSKAVLIVVHTSLEAVNRTTVKAGQQRVNKKSAENFDDPRRSGYSLFLGTDVKRKIFVLFIYLFIFFSSKIFYANHQWDLQTRVQSPRTRKQ
jgi:hypothetical protein